MLHRSIRHSLLASLEHTSASNWHAQHHITPPCSTSNHSLAYLDCASIPPAVYTTRSLLQCCRSQARPRSPQLAAAEADAAAVVAAEAAAVQHAVQTTCAPSKISDAHFTESRCVIPRGSSHTAAHLKDCAEAGRRTKLCNSRGIRAPHRNMFSTEARIQTMIIVVIVQRYRLRAMASQSEVPLNGAAEFCTLFCSRADMPTHPYVSAF